MASEQDKSLMRNLGEFFGHIVRAVKTDPARQDAPQSGHPTTSTQVHEETVIDPDGKRVVLRRTTIEEIEIVDEDATD